MTQEQLKLILNYDPETGIFTNRIRRGPNAPKGAVAGSEDVHGYWTIWLCNKSYKAHRLAWLYMTGEWPLEDIDHINGAKGDNRFENLRDVSRSKNVSNAGPQVNNYLQVRGVYLDGNKYRAVKTLNGIKHNLGSFNTLEEAAVAVEDWINATNN